jgi:hypothetical protein
VVWLPGEKNRDFMRGREVGLTIAIVGPRWCDPIPRSIAA